MLQTAPTVQRFFSVLGNALEIGLETTFPKSELSVLENMKRFGEIRGYTVRNPNDRGNKPDAKTVSLAHPAEIEGANLIPELLSYPDPSDPGKTRTIYFGPIPHGVAVLFQRLNFKQTLTDGILGLICGRHGEEKAFPIRQQTGAPYVNLDLFSKTADWNPLYVKYHLTTTRPESEFGYLRVDALKLKDIANRQIVSVYRVDADEVPEFLRAAETLPA